MEIGKNDVVGFVNSLTYDNPERRKTQNNTDVKSERQNKKGESSQILFDQVRNRAMRLDDEIKEYQNLLTDYQMQFKFLNKINNPRKWRSQLIRFLNEGENKLTENRKNNISEDISLTEYKIELKEKNQLFQNKLSKSQIKLQNIFASGLLPEPNISKISQNIMKIRNYEDIGPIFKNLRISGVHNLLS